MQRDSRMLPGVDPTVVVLDDPALQHETKYAVDRFGHELLLYRDAVGSEQLRADRRRLRASRVTTRVPDSLRRTYLRSLQRAGRLGDRLTAGALTARSGRDLDAGGSPLTPRRARRLAAYDPTTEALVRREEVLAALRQANLQPVLVPAGPGTPATVMLRETDGAAAVSALATNLGPEWQVLPFDDDAAQPGPRRAGARRVSTRRLRRLAQHDGGFRLFRYVSAGPGQVVAGPELTVDVEIWRVAQLPDAHEPERGPGALPSEADGMLVAPRRQSWTTHVSEQQWRTAAADGSLVTSQAPHLLQTGGPIDVVYTWVDGEDPAWNAQRLAALGAPVETPLAEAATHAARFRSNDELRYSLRSLEMFAPWVRRIYLVTAGQVPEWLDTSHPQLRVVDHRDIFRDPGVLPVFNSHAIESQLHHIDGLSERYLYLNDDVFFGRPVDPSLFFHGNGLAKFFTSSALMDAGPHEAHDDPVTSAAKNNRQLVADVFGRHVTHIFQHTPHPQLRSVLEHMEISHPELFEQVAASTFRHPDDVSISSALHHYYAYGLGKAVPGRLAYMYLDLAHPRADKRLRDLLRRRDRDVFCLNDSPGVDEGQGDLLGEFLAAYFPLASSFERQGDHGQAELVAHREIARSTTQA